MKRIVRSSLVAISLALGTLALIDRAVAGKPKPPLLPPIKYQIQFWDVPNPGGYKQINKMNNRGQAVGYFDLTNGERHGFLYDPAVNATTAIDLNVLVVADDAVREDDWVVQSGVGINDNGVIVGSLQPVNSPYPTRSRGFVLDTDVLPTLQVIPDDAWSYTYARRINKIGDIAGLFLNPDQKTWGVYVYNPAVGTPPITLGQTISPASICINNPVGPRPAQIAGQLSGGLPFRWTTGGQDIETFPSINYPFVEDINDSGTFCGGAFTKGHVTPMRYNTSLNILSAPGQIAGAINATGDLTTDGLLYHDSWGFLNLDDLIDRNDPDAALWFAGSRFVPIDLTDRDSVTNFGEVVGQLEFADGSRTFFLLTPVLAP